MRSSVGNRLRLLLLPTVSQPPLHYASLLVGDIRYDALEFSAAGLSLSRMEVERTGLRALRRGDECEATLSLGGAAWEERYDVVLRLAARGPGHVGFAFVTLPPPARRLLGRVPEGRGANGPDDEIATFEDPRFEGAPWGRRLAPFAFARLAEQDGASRRLALSASATVFALTQRRNRDNGLRPEATAPRPLPAGVLQLGTQEHPVLPPSALFAYGAALLAVLAVFWAVVFG